LARNDLVDCARPTLAGARFCLTHNQITRQLGLKQHHGRRRYRTASRIAWAVRNSSPLNRNLSADFAATLGTALPKTMCAPGRDNVRLLRLCPKRRGPRAACRRRIRDFHCCGRHILCRGRRNPFTHPATRLAAPKRHVPVQRQHPGKFYRHDWRVDAFAPPLSAHEPRPG
jgi:hypothetical protein